MKRKNKAKLRLKRSSGPGVKLPKVTNKLASPSVFGLRPIDGLAARQLAEPRETPIKPGSKVCVWCGEVFKSRAQRENHVLHVHPIATARVKRS